MSESPLRESDFASDLGEPAPPEHTAGSPRHRWWATPTAVFAGIVVGMVLLGQLIATATKDEIVDGVLAAALDMMEETDQDAFMEMMADRIAEESVKQNQQTDEERAEFNELLASKIAEMNKPDAKTAAESQRQITDAVVELVSQQMAEADMAMFEDAIVAAIIPLIDEQIASADFDAIIEDMTPQLIDAILSGVDMQQMMDSMAPQVVEAILADVDIESAMTSVMDDIDMDRMINGAVASMDMDAVMSSAMAHIDMGVMVRQIMNEITTEDMMRWIFCSSNPNSLICR